MSNKMSNEFCGVCGGYIGSESFTSGSFVVSVCEECQEHQAVELLKETPDEN